MRVAVLNWRDEVHPEAGGAELYCHQVSRELVAAGHTVTYVTARPGRAPRREEHADGYTVVRRGGRLGVYPAVLAWLLRHRRDVDAVLDSQNGIPFFSPLAVPARTPVVQLVHHVHQDQFALYFPRPVAALGRWLEGPAARAVYGRRAVAAVSPSTRSAVRRRLRLRGPISLTPCGLEGPGGPPRRRSATPTLVALGRLVPHKRLALLVQALPQVTAAAGPVVLHVVGDGPERASLVALADRLGVADRVVFHGRVTDARRDQLLAESWLTVNPTAGEGWGLSILEANRLGVTALAHRVDGVRDSVVDGVTGWLVDPAAPLAPAVTAALAELADPGTRDRMETAARDWAASYTWERTATALAALLAGESHRLRLATDQRVPSDLATVVRLPRAELPADWSPRLRAGDGLVRDATEVRLLVHGADHAAVVALLLREGVPAALVDGGRVAVSVAGQQEALLLTAGSATRPSPAPPAPARTVLSGGPR
ncbi:glycosyltransferase family 4 protein [Rhodococcus aerolatus]